MRHPRHILRQTARLGVIALLLAYTALYCAPLPAPPAPRALPESTKILDRQGRPLYDSAGPADARYSYLPLAEMPERLRQAVIATEDASFYDNPGIDARGIVRAALTDLRHGEIRSGGSTITQQLARNLYFDPDERSSASPVRKAREALLALQLDRSLSKGEILERYLNRVYFGNLAYGVEAAAQTYFGKSARELDLSESALLAGLLQSPSDYDPFTHLDAARQRQAIVLGRMADVGYLTPDGAGAASHEPISLNRTPFAIEAPHFVAWVRQQLPQLVGGDAVAHGELRVTTSLDLDVQRAAEAAITRQVAVMKDHHLTNAAVVAIDPATGEVRAMAGSADYFDSAIDGAFNAALAARQPGSSIKPVVYAAALEAGFTLASPLLDVPATLRTRQGDPYAPNNYDFTFHGIVPLREALASSYNVPAVRVLQAIGVDRAVEMGRRLGLTTFTDPSRYDLSLTLGGGEVRLLDLTAAYAAFAAGGLRVDPVAILRIEDTSGRVLYAAPPPARERVVSAQTAYLVTDMLADNDARTPGFGARSPLSLDRPAAAKTGTTTDFHDNWTLGYTPDLAVGVWAGNSDNSAMRDVSGVDGAAPIWRGVMQAALAGKPVTPFAEPPGIEHVAVCVPSGLLPTPACQRQRVELFAPGTAPTALDDYYRSLPICDAIGAVAYGASARCPGPVRSRVFAFVPLEAIPWARAAGVALPPVPPYIDAPASSMDSPAPARVPLLLVSPADGITLHISHAVRLEDQALMVEALPSARVASVELYVDGAVLAVAASPPYRQSWPLRPGEHEFRARAATADGTEIWSQAATVTVLPP